MLKTVSFNISEAHKLVRAERAAGNDVRWDGWDIVFHRPAPHAINSPAGEFRNGGWGFKNRFEVDSEGMWNIEERNLRSLRRSRNRR